VGLGDRFHYFRGVSGRRYLFTAVARQDLGDFRSVVVLLARPAANGRLAAGWIATTDAFGRIDVRDRRLPDWPDAVVLVHLLAETDRERRDLVADLSAPDFASNFALAFAPALAA
jgi:hypothetical protein